MNKPKEGKSRDKQVCVLLTSEVLEDFKKITYFEQVSPNYKIYQLVKQYVAEHQEQVEAYNKIFSK